MATDTTIDTTERDTKILELDRQGKSRRAIASELGIGKSTVDHVINTHKLVSANLTTDGPQQVPREHIAANPWQPRSARTIPELLDDPDVAELADNIRELGLLQNPVARRIRADLYELAFGHRRVAAIALLSHRGEWTGGIPLVVKDLSDRDMALAALAENQRRKQLTPVEEVRAYQRALETAEGLTITDLARSIGVDRSTLSNNLRVLKLPAVVLDRVDSGEMPLASAREFLCLQNDDHCHEDEMARVIGEIAGTGGRYGAPDWRRAHVRELIHGRAMNNDAQWRPLEPHGLSANEKHWFGGNIHREPSFEAQPYMRELPNLVHHIPALKSDGSKAWTCDVKLWQKVQTAATRRQNQEAAAQGEAPAPAKKAPSASADPVRFLANDPLGRQVLLDGVSLETVRSAVTKRILEAQPPDSAEGAAYLRLNQRVARFLEYHTDQAAIDNLVRSAKDLHQLLNMGEAGIQPEQTAAAVATMVEKYQAEVDKRAARKLPKALTQQHREALGTRATIAPDAYRLPFHKDLDSVPEYLADRQECLERCTWGAQYCIPYRGAAPDLLCTNKVCFESKLERGRAQFQEMLDAAKVRHEARARELVPAYAAQMNDAMARAVVMALMRDEKDIDHRGPVDRGHRGEFSYYPDFLVEKLAAVGIQPEPHRWMNMQVLDAEKVLAALPAAPDKPGLAAALLVYLSGADMEAANES